VKWIQLAHDGNLWRVLVNTVIKHRVLEQWKRKREMSASVLYGRPVLK